MTNSDRRGSDLQKNLLSAAMREALIKNKGWQYEPILSYLGGSAAYGFRSRGSDLDWFFLCNSELERGSKLLKKDGTVQSDLMLVDYDNILRILHKLDVKREHCRYPTVFYRSSEEEALYRSSHPYRGKDPSCFYEDDVKFFDFCIFLRAERLWLNEKYAGFDLFTLYDRARTIDFMDAHYVRAYGNFNNFIRRNVHVTPRKYLYTMQHLLTINWILEKRSRAPLNYLNFQRNMSFDSQLTEHMDNVIARNASSTVEKEKNSMEADVWLNHYIEVQLESLRPRLEHYNKAETYGDLMRQTPKDFLPNVILCNMSKSIETTVDDEPK